VFREVASGAKTDRLQFRGATEQLDAGDVPMVTRLDRLVRSTRDLLNGLLLHIPGRAEVGHRAPNGDTREWQQSGCVAQT